MCSIVIIGALVTMTGCQHPKPSGATVAENTQVVASKLTPWVPVLKREVVHPRVVYVQPKPAPPLPMPTHTINVNVTTYQDPCPPRSYACQILPIVVSGTSADRGPARPVPVRKGGGRQ
jgi:hypothetical protein